MSKGLDKMNGRTVTPTVDRVKYKFSIDAGLLWRGQIRRELNRASFEWVNPKVEYTESKSLFYSTFYITLIGDEDKVKNGIVSFKNACAGL